MSTKDIREISLVDLESFLLEIKEPKFRAKQIWQWLWEKKARDFDSMQNIPKKLRDQLKQAFTFRITQIDQAQYSKDGTIKVIFKLWDDNRVEGVLIPTKKRTTACISNRIHQAKALQKEFMIVLPSCQPKTSK